MRIANSRIPRCVRIGGGARIVEEDGEVEDVVPLAALVEALDCLVIAVDCVPPPIVSVLVDRIVQCPHHGVDQASGVLPQPDPAAERAIGHMRIASLADCVSMNAHELPVSDAARTT